MRGPSPNREAAAVPNAKPPEAGTFDLQKQNSPQQSPEKKPPRLPTSFHRSNAKTEPPTANPKCRTEKELRNRFQKASAKKPERKRRFPKPRRVKEAKLETIPSRSRRNRASCRGAQTAQQMRTARALTALKQKNSEGKRQRTPQGAAPGNSARGKRTFPAKPKRKSGPCAAALQGTCDSRTASKKASAKKPERKRRFPKPRRAKEANSEATPSACRNRASCRGAQTAQQMRTARALTALKQKKNSKGSVSAVCESPAPGSRPPRCRPQCPSRPRSPRRPRRCSQWSLRGRQ